MGIPTEPAGPNGNSKCDSPVSLADSMLEFAQKAGSSAKFSIFTGDVVEGESWLRIYWSEFFLNLGHKSCGLARESKVRHLQT